jgi:hypothetical protein
LNVEAVVLVGPQSPFLQILSAVLSGGWTVESATDRVTLAQILSTTRPAVVIFDHTEPTDLFDLNPRAMGFSGPLLLLADEPATATQVLEADVFLRRPSDLFELSRLIEDLIRRSQIR